MNQLAHSLGISADTVKKILEGEGIKIRSQRDAQKPKFPVLHQLEIGDLVIINWRDVTQPHKRFYEMAAGRGMRFSVKTVSKGQYKVHRVG